MRGRKVGETSGETLGIKEPRQKAPPCPNSTLQTPLPQPKIVVGQRRRRSLGTEGRMAKAKDCFREPGQEHAEIP